MHVLRYGYGDVDIEKIKESRLKGQENNEQVLSAMIGEMKRKIKTISNRKKN